MTLEDCYRKLAAIDPTTNAYLIRPDGSIDQIQPKNGIEFHLPQLYDLICCQTIEVLYPTTDTVMILDEDGKRHQWPMNALATVVMAGRLQPGDVIVGNVILCPNRMLT